MAAHSSILAWKIPRTEEPGRYRPWGCKESDTAERTHTVPVGQSQVPLFPALGALVFQPA